MNQSGRTRRRLIQLGAVSLTAAIAGCGQSETSGANREGPDYSDSTDENTESDDDPNEPPAPALSFQAPNINYNIYNLDTADERPVPGDMAINHKDNTIFNITIDDEDTATATLDATNVERKIDLRLYVRDTYGTFKSDTQHLSETDPDSYENHEVEFDLTNINLPTGAGSICELVAVDPSFNEDYEYILKRHQFVGVAHKNGVNWVNQENFNHTYQIKEGETILTRKTPRGVSGVRGNKRSEPAGYVETRDGDDERTVFLVTRTPRNGELFGVSAHVKHKPARDFKNGSYQYKFTYGHRYECHFATEITHFRELATKTHEAISDIGVTSTHGRLSVLGDMIQMIPYIPQANDPNPTVVLYDHYGDCSSKSMMMSCILQNDPWNVMPGYIDAEFNDVGHWTIGLDVDDIPDIPDQDSLYTIPTTNDQVDEGFPDTEYAFFDMTYDSDIGQRTEGIENPVIWDEGNFAHTTSRRSDNPPNY
ncbi:hypothetical protein [Halobaculum rarum]|uniref:hypothetical protein n=1 Tax=Halobaculum rarum TaxID=3075122 RepID=UPI0032AF74F3